MNTMVSTTLVAAALAAGVTLVAQDAAAQGRPVAAVMTGAAEVPGPGDPDGTGEVFMTLNVGRGEICYQITVSDIAPATAAHIHVGTSDVAGPVVVGLAAPTTGSSSACVSADRELVKAILQSPQDYYVNVHNSPFPAGAIRGQLAK